MRVVHLSTNESNGGAALASRRLHGALIASGVGSTMFVGLAQNGDEGVVEFNPAAPAPRGLGRLLFRAARRAQHQVRTIDGPLFSQDWTVFKRAALRQIPAADISNLHWTADLVDYRMLAPLARRGPLVWTMHDMNPFTGGCHYDASCGRFTAACGECPLLIAPSPADVSTRVLERKARALAALPDDGLTLVSPSRWLAGQARGSAIFGRFDARVIPNGIDLEVFRPAADRESVRARLGLGPQDRAILFVAELLDDRRKGRRELERALARISGFPRLRVMTLGQRDAGSMEGPAYLHLGRVADPAAVRDAYCAADLFVIPSLQDNFPNTVIESLACGTAVVGFSIGGVVDAVEEGACGSLAAPGDTEGLADRIVRLLANDAARRAMGDAGRRRAVAMYGLEKQAAAYRALYAELLDARRARTIATQGRVAPLLFA